MGTEDVVADRPSRNRAGNHVAGEMLLAKNAAHADACRRRVMLSPLGILAPLKIGDRKTPWQIATASSAFSP